MKKFSEKQKEGKKRQIKNRKAWEQREEEIG